MLTSLDDEAPAVVNLLTHKGRLTDEAVPATVIDLAARGYVHLEEVVQGQHLCRLPHAQPAGSLLPFEARVLDLLRHRVVAHTVPADALGLGVVDEHQSWWAEFTREVGNEARSNGLCRIVQQWVPGILAGLIYGIAVLVSTGSEDSAILRTVAMVGIAISAALVLYIDGDFSYHLTFTGRRAARRWKKTRDELDEAESFHRVPAPGVAIWGRHLAYAAALGIASTACRDLPMGPDSSHSVSVRRGGMWRHIRIHYPTRLPPGWGRPPVLNTLIGATGVAISATLVVLALRPGAWHPNPPFSPGAARVIGDLEPVIAGIALAFLPFAVWQLWGGVLDLIGSPRTIEGVVATRWIRQGRRLNPWGDLVPRRYYVAVDDGRSETLVGWRLPLRAFVGVRKGDPITALVDRRLGHVRDIDVNAR